MVIQLAISHLFRLCDFFQPFYASLDKVAEFQLCLDLYFRRAHLRAIYLAVDLAILFHLRKAAHLCVIIKEVVVEHLQRRLASVEAALAYLDVIVGHFVFPAHFVLEIPALEISVESFIRFHIVNTLFLILLYNQPTLSC